MRSDISHTVGSVSQTEPLPTGFVFDWILLLLLFIVSRVDFMDFVLFLEAVWSEGVLLRDGERSVGISALRAFSASNARFTRDEPSSNRTGGVGLARKPPKVRSWRGSQPRAAKALASVAVVGKMSSIQRAAATAYTPRASGARNARR